MKVLKRIILGLILVALGAGIERAQDLKGRRFEEIYNQNMPSPADDQGGMQLKFRVFHDRETNQEIVCAEGSTNRWARVDSCYLTGRAWR